MRRHLPAARHPVKHAVVPVKPAPPPIPAASCTLEASTNAAATPGVAPSLTVGDKMTLDCSGSFGAAAGANLQVVPVSPDANYQLYVLSVAQSTPQEVRAVVTSYRTGKIDQKTYKLSDGKVTFMTSPVSFNVESVMQPSHPVMKPYASVGPFEIPYPLWFWLLWAFLIIAVVGGLGYVFYRRRRRKKLLAELERYTTNLPAFAQYSKDVRAMARRLTAAKADSEAVDLVKKIEEDFRLYLIRELRVPALQVSDREVLRELRSSQKIIYNDFQSDLRRLFFELNKSRSSTPDNIKLKDCEDLLFLSRRLADGIQAVKRRATK